MGWSISPSKPDARPSEKALPAPQHVVNDWVHGSVVMSTTAVAAQVGRFIPAVVVAETALLAPALPTK
jgi:hypothetical protein